MTTEQKLNKLIDLFIEYGEGGMFLSDLTDRLKELSTSGCAEHDICLGCLGMTGCTCDEIKVATATASEDGLATARLNVDSNNATPWLPNPGDGCWVIHPAYNSPAQDYWGSPEPTKCQLALWKLGLVFRTKEEAMAEINSLLNL